MTESVSIVYSTFISSMMSSAAILAAVNSRLVASAAANTQRFTVKSVMGDLARRTHLQAKSFQLSAANASSGLKFESTNMIGSVSYLFSSSLFALSSALVDDGLISYEYLKDFSEFKYLNESELTTEISETAQCMIDDVSTSSDDDSFEDTINQLKKSRAETLSTMHEVYMLLQKTSSKRDNVLIYMDVIRDVFNYSIACIESSIKASEYKFSQSVEIDVETVSVEIKTPLHRNIESYISLKRGAIEGDLRDYVKRSYQMLNQLIDLTDAYVVSRIHLNAFTRFVTIKNSFKLIINGKQYNMSEDDVTRSCSSFHNILVLSSNKVYENAWNQNRKDLYKASAVDLPSFINSKIQLSRSAQADVVALQSKQDDFLDQFKRDGVDAAEAKLNQRYLQTKLGDFIHHDYDIVNMQGSPDEFKPLEDISGNILVDHVFEKTYGSPDGVSTAGVSENDAMLFDAMVRRFGSTNTEVPVYDISGNGLIVEIASGGAIDNVKLAKKYLKQSENVLPTINNYEKIQKTRIEELEKFSNTLKEVRNRMILDQTMGQEVSPEAIGSLAALIHRIEMNEDLNSNDKHNFDTSIDPTSDVSGNEVVRIFPTDTGPGDKVPDFVRYHMTDQMKAKFENYMTYSDNIQRFESDDKGVYFDAVTTEEYPYPKGNFKLNKNDNTATIPQNKATLGIVQTIIGNLEGTISDLKDAIMVTEKEKDDNTRALEQYENQLRTVRQDLLTAVRNKEESVRTLTKVDDCIELARTKINEIINVRDVIQNTYETRYDGGVGSQVVMK